ncbi:MAG: phosphoglycerate dehydrogenase [Eubacteriales bacterium]|nr:phosphoglycerate dehydrogenase [Eubacteriales bacterium]MDD3504578.1 phosphoglycerate dehydrogenase [Eubacteriales bacterium]
MKILIAEKIAAESVAYLREQGFDVDEKLGLAQSQIEEEIAPYDGLIVRSVTQVNRSLVEKAKNLKVVGRAGNGIDNIDVDVCTEKGVVAVNTPEANIMAAGELAVGLAFASFRNICIANEAARRDDFRRGQMIGNELDGKTAGIIGMGRIGSIVARKLKGIGMKVVVYDPYIPQERFDKLSVKRCSSLDDLLVQADLITLHTPKTKETYNIIGAAELAKCKPGVRIVNAARGGLVNEDALYDALVSGHVAAAGIDVFDKEPSYDKKPGEQKYENKLLSLSNCVVTPHLGASSHEANTNVGTAVTELVASVLKGELVAAINMPDIDGDLAAMRPYVNLAEKLGAIYYQAESSPVRSITITYSGELAKTETELLTLSVLKGFLSTITNERISFVNVKQRVADMGVDVVESKTTQLEKYTSLITVEFKADEKSLSVSGTVFGQESEILVDFFGYHMDFELSDHVLALQNDDVPGIIGRVGTILGLNKINIATMHWSRKKDKMRAQSFLSIDSPVEEDVIEKLRSIEGVLRVSVLDF